MRTAPFTLSVVTLCLSILLDVLMIPLLLIALPWLLFKIVIEGRGFGSLRDRIGRAYISRPSRPRILIHAASVGEVRMTVPLLRELRDKHPGKEFIVTTMTTGAYDLAQRILPECQVQLLPLDLGVFMNSFLSRIQPTAVILVELEYWPQFLLACKARSIPVLVVNGRISDRGLKRWQKWNWLLGWMTRIPSRVLARSEEDADRFVQIGTPAERVRITGNLKYDMAKPEVSRRGSSSNRGFTWMAGCTHPGEEDVVLSVHRELLQEFPDIHLIIAPRHIERSETVRKQVSASGWGPIFSSGSNVAKGDEVVIVDQLGVLDEFYEQSDAAFVGGSLVQRGGHNLLEPVLSGCFTCHGPHVQNFRDMATPLAEMGAVREVQDRQELLMWLQKRIQCRSEGPLSQGLISRVRENLGGAAKRTVKDLAPWID